MAWVVPFVPSDITMRKTAEERERERLSRVRSEAGKKGGLATLRRHGKGYFRKIGKAGGKRSGGAKHAR